MSPIHPSDDLPGAVRDDLARAADAVEVPGDPVTKVRATLQRRHRRRSAVRAGAASAGAAAVLVAAVVLVPGQLRPDAAPPAGPPSATTTGEPVGTELTPQGLPGLVLGEEPDVPEENRRPTASGCERVETREVSAQALGQTGLDATELVVWLRDGEVASLVMAVYPDRVVVPGDVPRTWLGPTLRSPLATALELPGAELVVDDPQGPAGPGVRNVVVPLEDGGEVVFSDPAVQGGSADGAVTVLTLRSEAGRACRPLPGQDYPTPGDLAPGQTEPLVLDARGTPEVRLGASAPDAVAAGTLSVVGSQGGFDPLGSGGGRCEEHTTPDGLRVYALDDRVVAIGSFGFGPAFALDAEPAVRSGEPFTALADAPGALPVRALAGMAGSGLDLPVATGVRARVLGAAEEVVTETAGIVLLGDELVEGLLLYEGDELADQVCR